MLVVGFGTYDGTRHPRPANLLSGLRELGASVTELNEPLGFSTAERVAMMQRPWLLHRLVVRLLACWCRLSIKRLRWAVRPGAGARTRFARPHAVFVGYLGHLDVALARILFPRTPIVLDMLIFARDTAIDRGERSRVKLSLMGFVDRFAASMATLVVVDTDENVLLVPAKHRHKAVVAPVGAGPEWFRQSSSLPRSSPASDTSLSVIFFGLFTPLQGASVITTALARLHGVAAIHVTMVGTGQHRDAAQELADGVGSMEWLDWVNPDALPELVQRADVCLGIFGDTPKASRVVPNKVFQGAASGCAIVTSDTGPQRRALGDAAVYVKPGDPDALSAALLNLAEHPTEVDRFRKLATERAHDHFQPRHIAAPLLAAIQAIT